MSIRVARRFHALVPMAVLAFTIATLDGCSKADDENASSSLNNPNKQAQAAQSAIAAARAEKDPRAAGMTDGGAGAPAASMATGAPGATGAAAAPMAMGAPDAVSPPANMAAPTAGAATGMARMLGQPPNAGASTAAGLPSAIGAPHIYHLGADTFFLDQASAIGLTPEQQKKLTSLKESGAMAFATTQRKIDQKEQDLWVITSSEMPDIAKIDARIGEVARLTGQQRMDFIRTIGAAVGVLSDVQRKAVASQAAMQPGTMTSPPAAPTASGMNMGSAVPSTSGMEVSAPNKMPMRMGPSGAMPPPGMPGMGMGGMADAGAAGGMGHM
jgi:hypothetical protein